MVVVTTTKHTCFPSSLERLGSCLLGGLAVFEDRRERGLRPRGQLGPATKLTCQTLGFLPVGPLPPLHLLSQPPSQGALDWGRHTHCAPSPDLPAVFPVALAHPLGEVGRLIKPLGGAGARRESMSSRK